MFLPNFRKSGNLVDLAAWLDTGVGKYAENNKHTDFYLENLVPNQDKKPRPTTRRILPITRRTFPLTQANGYKQLTQLQVTHTLMFNTLEH